MVPGFVVSARCSVREVRCSYSERLVRPRHVRCSTRNGWFAHGTYAVRACVSVARKVRCSGFWLLRIQTPSRFAGSVERVDQCAVCGLRVPRSLTEVAAGRALGDDTVCPRSRPRPRTAVTQPECKSQAPALADTSSTSLVRDHRRSVGRLRSDTTRRDAIMAAAAAVLSAPEARAPAHSLRARARSHSC
jgi:hypothetical protein